MKNVNQRRTIYDDFNEIYDILDRILKREKEMNKRVAKLEKRRATK